MHTPLSSGRNGITSRYVKWIRLEKYSIWYFMISMHGWPGIVYTIYIYYIYLHCICVFYFFFKTMHAAFFSLEFYAWSLITLWSLEYICSVRIQTRLIVSEFRSQLSPSTRLSMVSGIWSVNKCRTHMYTPRQQLVSYMHVFYRQKNYICTFWSLNMLTFSWSQM